MAEATLVVSTVECGKGYSTCTFSREAARNFRIVPPADTADTQVGVSCGKAVPGERIAIVEPEPTARLPALQVGEIWVSGPTSPGLLAQGRRHRRDLQGANRRRGRRRLAADRRSRLPGRGRRPVHHRPHQGAHHHPRHEPLSAGHRADRAGRASGAAPDGGAAFSVTDERGEETLVVVQEVERTARNRIDTDDMTGTHPRGGRQRARIVARHVALDPAEHLAQDHQRQDPAQPGTPALARRPSRSADRQIGRLEQQHSAGANGSGPHHRNDGGPSLSRGMKTIMRASSRTGRASIATSIMHPRRPQSSSARKRFAPIAVLFEAHQPFDISQQFRAGAPARA